MINTDDLKVLKDVRAYLDTDVWLLGISLFSIVDISSVLVYKEDIFHSYEVFKNNYLLIIITGFLFYAGWKVLPPLVRLFWLIIEAGLLEFGWYKPDSDNIWKSTSRTRNAKKYALKNLNSLVLNILSLAEVKAQKREYTAQLYVWNYLLFVIIFFMYFSIDFKTSGLPFYWQIYQYIQYLQLTIQNSLLISFIEILCSIAFIGIILKTLGEIWMYLQYDDFVFIPIDEMHIIEEIINEA